MSILPGACRAFGVPPGWQCSDSDVRAILDRNLERVVMRVELDLYLLSDGEKVNECRPKKQQPVARLKRWLSPGPTGEYQLACWHRAAPSKLSEALSRVCVDERNSHFHCS